MAGYVQESPLLPSQVPPHEDPSEAHAGRAPCGAPSTARHAPGLLGTSHAWHCPLQDWSQQTPSAQNPEAHWFAPAQAAPGPSWGVQTPAEQKLLAEQSASRTQSPRHAVAPQTYGSQACVCCTGQWPAPSQDAASVAAPAPQLASRHCAVG